VSAGDSLKDEWPLDAFEEKNYHLRVYGPNGFFREFKGDQKDPLIQINCGYQKNRILKKKLTGNLELNISNLSNGKAYDVKIMDNAYKKEPVFKKIGNENETVVLDLSPSFGWYDFTVIVKGNSTFSQRFAGRVETGKESFTDPFMGKV
jgi:phospholipase C